jgi:hypothetical protein
MKENTQHTGKHYKSVLKDGKTVDNETFDDLIKEKHAFVKFHSTNCGHCLNMADAWKELGNGEPLGIYIIEVDVDGLSTIHSVCKNGANAGVPYIAMVNKDGTVFKEYTGGRSADIMKKFITDNAVSFNEKNNGVNELKDNKVGGGFKKRMKRRKSIKQWKNKTMKKTKTKTMKKTKKVKKTKKGKRVKINKQ